MVSFIIPLPRTSLDYSLRVLITSITVRWNLNPRVGLLTVKLGIAQDGIVTLLTVTILDEP